MEQIAFRMQLNPGQAAVYERFLDPETNALFAVLRRAGDHKMDSLPEQEVMQRWWRAMADIMQTNPDGSPTATPLQPMFHLA